MLNYVRRGVMKLFAWHPNRSLEKIVSYSVGVELANQQFPNLNEVGRGEMTWLKNQKAKQRQK